MAQNQSEFCSDLLEQIYPALTCIQDFRFTFPATGQ